MYLGAIDGGMDSRGASTQSGEPSDFDKLMLLESIVTDVHWSALNVGTIVCVLNASRREGAMWSLYPWRRLLQDQAETMRLGLRFYREIGISASASALTLRLYEDLARAKRQSEALFATACPCKDIQRDALAGSLTTWSALSTIAISVLKQLDSESSNQLGSRYSENSRILSDFLREVSHGDMRRVNSFGEVSLPVLAQRRREPRRLVSLPCRIVVAGVEVDAIIRDVSRNGLGIESPYHFAEQDTVTVRISNREPLLAKVIWRKADRIGLALSTPLQGDDALLGMALGAGIRQAP